MLVRIQGKVWDCPGMLDYLGDLRTHSLKEIYKRTAEIRAMYDGGCAPRDAAMGRYSKIIPVAVANQ